MGCTESIEEDENLAKITSYNVTTQWATGCHCDGTYKEFEKNGFYHTVAIWDNPRFNITGTVKNIASQTLSTVNITGTLYDINQTKLCTTRDLNISIEITNLTVNQSKNFTFEIVPIDCARYLKKDISEPEVYHYYHSFESIDFIVKTSKY